MWFVFKFLPVYFPSPRMACKIHHIHIWSHPRKVQIIGRRSLPCVSMTKINKILPKGKTMPALAYVKLGFKIKLKPNWSTVEFAIIILQAWNSEKFICDINSQFLIFLDFRSSLHLSLRNFLNGSPFLFLILFLWGFT